MHADQPFAYPRRLSMAASLMVLVSMIVGSAAVLAAFLPMA